MILSNEILENERVMYVKLAGETILVRCGSPGANVRGYAHYPVARAQREQRITIKEMVPKPLY